jgi:hypothetical protein
MSTLLVRMAAVSVPKNRNGNDSDREKCTSKAQAVVLL